MIGGRGARRPAPFGIIKTVTSADRESERLTALGGLAALSLDALSSVAYGPEAILVVLVAAGTAGLRYSMPVTIAIVVLLVALVISYRQVIEAFPNGGGAYAVASRHLGKMPSLIAAHNSMYRGGEPPAPSTSPSTASALLDMLRLRRDPARIAALDTTLSPDLLAELDKATIQFR